MPPISQSDSDEPSDEESFEDSSSEWFGFVGEDHQAIVRLMAGIRRALNRPSITPEQICGMGKLLHGLQRLPLPTEGLDIIVTIRGHATLSLSESSFELCIGGMERTPGWGSDSYTTFSFMAEVGGYRDNHSVRQLEEAIAGFVESICDESEDLEVDDLNQGAGPDWLDERPEDAWERLGPLPCD